MKSSYTTIVDALLALEDCSRFGARFASPSAEHPFYPYGEVVRRARNAAAVLQAEGLEPGDRVAVVLPTSIEFLDAFLGVQLAGGIPVALYPPFRLGKLDEYFERVRRMLRKVGARFLITDSRVKRLLGPAVVGIDSLRHVLEAKDLKEGGPWKAPNIDPSQPAFLQFSSGSTVEPKAVMVSHSNLLANLDTMRQSLVYRDESELDHGAVCWLPLYHDMGLVGCLYQGLYYPATVTYLGPDAFLARPSIWLKTLSQYRAAISPAPNFAYGLCAAKIRDEELDGVDLSAWRMALNGAEPIDPLDLDRFCERFSRWGFRREALTPVYGLAEAGLAVTFSDWNTAPEITEFDRHLLSTAGRAAPGAGRKLVAVGKPLPGIGLEICDDLDRPVEPGTVGHIRVQGPSITTGYYGDPELTASVIRGGWLDTGDLGFLHEGNLYIAGRAKDIIILRGRNYAPQEFEEPLALVDGVRRGAAVAVGSVVDGLGEQLFVLAEKDSRSDLPDEQIAAGIKSAILSGVGLIPHHVEILKPGTLPRTSSGKLRRSEALRQFLAGELAPPADVNALKLLGEVGKSQLAWMRFRAEKK
jgi:acyl-CoA synthetase (AMP-forming)/AMP-acid ligase II